MPLWQVTTAETVCAECKKLPIDKQISCTHTETTVSWRPKKRLKQVSLAIGDQIIIQQDLLGQNVGNPDRLYPTDELERFKLLPRVKLPQIQLKDIFVCVDPSGGGRSKMGIVSAYYNAIEQELVVRMNDVFLFSKKTGSGDFFYSSSTSD